MGTARVDQLCDLTKSVIEAAAAVNPLRNEDGSAVTITVTCDDDPDLDADDMPGGTMYVLIYFDGYADGGPETRGADLTDYRLCFLVVEKYPLAGRVPTDWRRERTAWVDECVVKALGNARPQLDGAYAMTLDDLEYSTDELVERQLFWTRALITFRDTREVC